LCVCDTCPPPQLICDDDDDEWRRRRKTLLTLTFSLYSGNTLEKVNTLAHIQTVCVSFFSLSLSWRWTSFFFLEENLQIPFYNHMVHFFFSFGLKSVRGLKRLSADGDDIPQMATVIWPLLLLSTWRYFVSLFSCFWGVTRKSVGAPQQQNDEIVSFPNHFSSAMK
jgi:hypothetical protein